MITREQIRNLLNGIGDETISKSDADQMAADYPYFNIPQLLYLKFTPGAMPDEKRIQQALIYASPHAHLETILGVEGESFADMFNKRNKSEITEQQHRKIRGLIAYSIKPFLRERLKYK